jgi:hypothetical protein
VVHHLGRAPFVQLGIRSAPRTKGGKLGLEADLAHVASHEGCELFLAVRLE